MPETAAPTRTARREAICDAVFDLLGEVGYDQMSMDAIATRARTSKATLYRTWPHKPSLVIDAVTRRLGNTPEAPDTGTLRGDLVALMTRACEAVNSPDGTVLAGLISASMHNPELAGALYQCTYESKRAVHETIIDRAVARGEIPAATTPDTLHEVLHAMVLNRRMWAIGPLDADFVVHAVDDVLLPVLRRGCPAQG